MLKLNATIALNTELEKALEVLAGGPTKRTYTPEQLGVMLSNAIKAVKIANPEAGQMLIDHVATQFTHHLLETDHVTPRILQLASQGLSEREIWDQVFGPASQKEAQSSD